MTWMLQDEAANPYLDVCQYAAKSNEFFKRFKRRIDILGAETQLKFILENK